MPLFVWLAAIIGPLAKKLLTALGIGFVTYQGLALVANQARDEIIGSWGAIGGAAADLAAMSGIPQGVGIVLGAFMYRATLVALSRLAKITE